MTPEELEAEQKALLGFRTWAEERGHYRSVESLDRYLAMLKTLLGTGDEDE